MADGLTLMGIGWDGGGGSSGYSILLEDGDKLLLEIGDNLLIE